MRVRICEVTGGTSWWAWLCDSCAPSLEAEGNALRWGRAIKQPCRYCRTVGDSEEPFTPPQRKPPAPPKQPAPAVRPQAPHAWPARRALTARDPRTDRFNELLRAGVPRAAAIEQVEREFTAKGA